MSLGLIFWIIMLVWLVFGFALHNGWFTNATITTWGNSGLMFILFLLLGWKVFGAAIQG